MMFENKTLVELSHAGGLFSDGDWVESKDQDPEGTVRLIQLADIGDGRFRDRSSRFVTPEKVEELGGTYLRPGDVLIARMPEPLGRACVFPDIGRRAITAVDVCIFRPGGDANPQYVAHMVNAPQFRSNVFALQSGTTRKRISRKNLGTIGLPVPSREEQDAIVEEIEKQFTHLDAATAALFHASQKLKNYVASVLRAAVSPPNESWGKASIDQLVDRVTVGHVGPMKHEYQPEGVPFLRSQNVRPNRFDSTGLKYISPQFHEKLNKSRLHPGDVVVVRSGSVGTACVIPEGVCEANCSDLVVIKRPRDVRGKFLAFFLNSLAQKQVAEGTVGVALRHFNTKSVAAIEVAVPSLEEQDLIIARTDAILSTADQLNEQLVVQMARAKRLRESILHVASSGRPVSATSGALAS